MAFDSLALSAARSPRYHVEHKTPYSKTAIIHLFHLPPLCIILILTYQIEIKNHNFLILRHKEIPCILILVDDVNYARCDNVLGKEYTGFTRLVYFSVPSLSDR